MLKGKTQFRGFAEAGIALKFLLLAEHKYYDEDFFVKKSC
jgi:hypothetical protein